MLSSRRNILLFSGGQKFIPSDIPELDLWLDANKGVIKDGGNNVSQWDDRTNTHTFLQAVGANQPDWNANQINGHPTIDFNGTTDYLKEVIADWLIGSNTGSIFIVSIHSNNANITENYFTSSDEATNNDALYFTSGFNARNNSARIRFNDGGVNNAVYGDDNIEDGVARIITRESNGTSYVIRINGVNQSINELVVGDNNGKWLNDIANRDNISIGAVIRLTPGYIVSRFAEIIVYDAKISTADRAKVENYLSNKYNIV